MKKWHRLSVLVTSLVFVLAVGCSKKEKPASETAVPNPHAGMVNPHSGLANRALATDDDPLPLKLKGINSVEEMQKAARQIKNSALRKRFEHDFRLCFTENRNLRDYPAARSDLLKLVQKMPNFAPAYRLLGYTEFNIGFNIQKALEYYNKALAINPNYGEVHYALAFMYVMTDLNKGVMHFKKAMALGIPDEHNLGPQYYDRIQR